MLNARIVSIASTFAVTTATLVRRSLINDASFSKALCIHCLIHSFSEFSRGCGQDTKENCKQLADEKSCQDSAQCMWLGTRKASDPPYVYREAGCQEFDCAFGWGKNMCDQFKECSWDLEHKGMWCTYTLVLYMNADAFVLDIL